MTVVDASIVVRLLLALPEDASLRERIGRERLLHAPALIDAEVTSAIRGLVLSSKPGTSITPQRAAEMVLDFADLPVVRHPMLPIQPRALALRHNFTAYDAFYVGLAEALDMNLLTADRKFAGAPAAHHAQVETWR
ncbi:type II toxin-antitoxin system VapC family toxin [Flexivirga alba]|uniref:Ribonuclease VapC n=1 Tax=Flexivirga alba TaxID=702742 RepID=A0ABW2AM57_9MICO